MTVNGVRSLVVLGIGVLAGCSSAPVETTPEVFATVTPRAVARLGDGVFVLTEPLVFQIDSRSIVVPRGFLTDLASIPKPLHWWHGQVDASMAPAIVHDYLYWYQPCTDEEADAVMLVGMIGMQVGGFDRMAIYQGVRNFGEASFSENKELRKRGETRTLTEPYLQSLLGRPVDPQETLPSALAKARTASGLQTSEAAEPSVKSLCSAVLAKCKQCKRQ
jgi:hypothetical protein